MSIPVVDQRSFLAERPLAAGILAVELLDLLVLHIHVPVEVGVVGELLVADLTRSVVPVGR